MSQSRTLDITSQRMQQSFLILYMFVTVLCVTWSLSFPEGTSEKD